MVLTCRCPGSSPRLAVPLPDTDPSRFPSCAVLEPCAQMCVFVLEAEERFNVVAVRVARKRSQDESLLEACALPRPVRGAVSRPGCGADLRSSSGVLHPCRLSPGGPRGSGGHQQMLLPSVLPRGPLPSTGPLRMRRTPSA